MTRRDFSPTPKEYWKLFLSQHFARLFFAPFLRPYTCRRFSCSIVTALLIYVCVAEIEQVRCFSQELILAAKHVNGAQLKSIEGNSAIFQTQESELRVQLSEIVCWGSLCEPISYEWLCIRDGSLIAGTWQGSDNGHLLWRNGFLGDFSVPLNEVAGIVLQLPGFFPEKDALFNKILNSSGGRYVLLTNGDQLDATLLRRHPNGNVVIGTRFGEREFTPGQIQAVVFENKPVMKTEPIELAVGLKDGSRIMLTKVQQKPQPSSPSSSEAAIIQAEYQHVFQQLLDRHVKDICFLQAFGKVVYLSDLTPQAFIAVPFLEYVRPLQPDRNVAGGWLRAGDGIYLKGIGTYSACRIRYSLNGKFSHFAAEVAIDACAEKKGNVMCHVLVDGQRRATVGPIRGGDSPVPILVDVAAAETLDLVVDFGERADERDYTNWINARLVPATVTAAAP